ncbi:MAG: PEGA domain-containing protein [Candidatus Omnitrophica bacterium]|nr:PEGA domain-containing protein [Candidatus Omnitrophota bacterium]
MLTITPRTMVLTRRTIFFVFLSLYVILCPLLILTTFGYIINPIKQEVTQTGLIFLSSLPSGADIYLEKSHYRNRSPANLSGLLPGTYKITLKKKGYKPWVQSISVAAGKAATFNQIILIPKVWPAQRLAAGPFSKMEPLAGTNYILLAEHPFLGQYCVFDWKNKLLAPLLPARSRFADWPVSEIFSEQSSPVVIFQSASFWKNKYLYVDLGQTPFRILEITRLIKEKPTAWCWNSLYPKKLLLSTRDAAGLLDVETGAAEVKWLTGLKGCGSQGKWLYILDGRDDVYRESFDGAHREFLFPKPRWEGRSAAAANPERITWIANDIFLFSTVSGSLTTNVPPYVLLDGGLAGFRYDHKTERLLFWTKKDIGFAELTRRVRLKTERAVSSKIFKVHKVWDQGQAITDCFWAAGGTHLVFQDHSAIYLLEFVPTGKPRTEKITEVKAASSIFYTEEGKAIYFLNPKDGALTALSLIPE